VTSFPNPEDDVLVKRSTTQLRSLNEAEDMKMGRNFAIGLTIGSVWLITAATGFSSVILGLAGGAYARDGLPAVLLTGGACIVAGVFVLRRALRLPKEDASSRRSRRPFLLIVLAEIAGWGVANVACVTFWTWRAMVAVDLIIVGLHFVPLARVFNVSRYRMLGLLFCLIPVATLWLVSPDAQTGDVVSWIALPSFACSVVAAVFGLIGLVQSSQLTAKLAGALLERQKPI
jgi:hypothetical protein